MRTATEDNIQDIHHQAVKMNSIVGVSASAVGVKLLTGMPKPENALVLPITSTVRR